jgi:hypothetical protein
MSEYAPCPKCANTIAKKVGFTWWGGVLGPSLLSHVKCQRCGTAYNGKSGRSNTTGIVVYTLVGFIIAVGILGLLATLVRS